MLQGMRTDVRYGLRQIARSPWIAVLIVATLGIGIGANTALFTFANAVLTRPMPGVRNSDRLVWIAPTDARAGWPTSMAYPDFQDYRAQRSVFRDAMAFATLRMGVRVDGSDPEQVRGQVVTASFFAVLGARMALGRPFLPNEDSIPGANPVTILSHRFWQDRFAGDSGVVGRSVTINGAAFTVVGVAEEHFNGPTHSDPIAFWVPMSMVARAWPLQHEALTSRAVWWLSSIALLQPGIPAEAASSAVATVAARIARADSAAHGGITAHTERMRSGVRPGDMNDIVPVATLASLVTVLVLLIACANVTNVLLSRALRRRQEIAVRVSIGASRARVVRQLLTESVILALCASVAGTLLAVWGTDLVASQIPAPIGIAVDARVLLFATFGAMVTTCLFGLVPALYATRDDPQQSLRLVAVGSDARRSRLQSGFVVAQVALSLVLLSTAGVFLNGLRHATRTAVGFDASRRVLAMTFDLGMQGYSPDAAGRFVQEISSRASAVPGVEHVALTTSVPLGERNAILTPWLEQPRPQGGTRVVERHDIETYYYAVTPAYFAVLDLPLARGRSFTAADGAGAPRVCIVSEGFARQAWGDRDAIGQRVATSDTGSAMTVVGIARDAMLTSPAARPHPSLYVPQAQHAEVREMTLMARSRGDAATLAAPLRAEFRALEASLPITGIQTLAQYKWDRLSESRLGSWILAVFGSIALLLAIIGVYAVIAFSVSQRTREIGVRVALGAAHRQVVGMFVSHGMRLTAYGVGVGLALAAAVGRVLSSAFFGVSAWDVTALGGVAGLLTAIALLACWLPARRAARVDPVRALRYE